MLRDPRHCSFFRFCFELLLDWDGNRWNCVDVVEMIVVVIVEERSCCCCSRTDRKGRSAGMRHRADTKAAFCDQLSHIHMILE